MQLNAIDFKFLQKIMQEISITFLKLGTSNEKTRMYHTNPQRICPINKYIYPILKGYLEEQDHKGFILSARSKVAWQLFFFCNHISLIPLSIELLFLVKQFKDCF